MAAYTRELVQHPTSGEAYALQFCRGEIVGLCGPLDQEDRAYALKHGLDELEYDVVDLEWAASVEWLPPYPPEHYRYTTLQVAELLGITDGRVRQLARDLGVGQRLGRDWAFTGADVARLRERETTPGPKAKSD